MKRLPAFAALAVAVTAILLPACGGGDEEQSNTAERERQEGAAARGQQSNGNKQGSGREADSEQASGQKKSGSNPTSSGAPVPGTKSPAPGVPIVKGGDNSIQVFGVEGEVDDRDRAIATLKVYLNARVAGDWARACAAASREFKEQLAQMIAMARTRDEARKPEGCVDTLRQLFAETPKAALRTAAQVNEVLSFRVEGDYAYIIFKGAEGIVRFIAMANDDGEWKVNVLEPAEFPEAP